MAALQTAFQAKPIFVENIPIIGEVPMGKCLHLSLIYLQFCSLVFYIPDPSHKCENDEKKKLKALIEKYGGILSEFHECFTYQVELI